MFTEKSDRGRGSRKTNIWGELPEKGGLDSLEILRGHGEKDRGEVFEVGVDTPMHTIESPSTETF